MTFKEGVSNAVRSTGHYLLPFGRAERLLAAMCMGIPPFLILAEQGEKIGTPMFIFIIAAMLITPFIIAAIAERIKQSGSRLASVLVIPAVTAFMFVMYWWLVTDGGMTALKSISIYVTMTDSYIFGVLLTVPAMLFAVNGLVYWTVPDPGKGRWGTWRAIINIVAGFALVNVALIHCVRNRTEHLVAASVFFLCCALTCIGNERKDWLTYTISLLVMGAGGFILLGNLQGWFTFYPHLFTIFGAEAIALWVTGVNYIMISLERVQVNVPVKAHA